MIKEYKNYTYVKNLNGSYYIGFTNIDQYGNITIESYDEITEEEVKKLIDLKEIVRKWNIKE